MACIDVDALAQFETDAKSGRPDAMYNLGLAYSTGQGVDVDFITATEANLGDTYAAVTSRSYHTGGVNAVSVGPREFS